MEMWCSFPGASGWKTILDIKPKKYGEGCEYLILTGEEYQWLGDGWFHLTVQPRASWVESWNPNQSRTR
jgi:hypothetical protein